MQIRLDVNELVEQLVKITESQNEALNEVKRMREELSETKSKLVDYETEELKKRIEFEKDLELMSKEYEENNIAKQSKKAV